MEEIIRIDLPITKYKLTTEGLLFKMSVPDFAKLLKIIRQQAIPNEKSAAEYYLEIRQLMTEAAAEYGPVYEYQRFYLDEDGIEHSKTVRVVVRDRFTQLKGKLEAAEKRAH